ncbi:hypothetical protein [Anaerococcus vaginalis]|uniref:hypothetical protein n=1 Tax=Anaerococcus vaginalis TaxID=33037 RepID=UPI00189AAFE1|nr:hypothetical protein [Anaerococcus vaginalis]
MRKYLKDLVYDFFGDEFCQNIDVSSVFSDFSHTSYDDNDGEIFIDSNDKCIDFDKVKEYYFKKHNTKHQKIHERKNHGSKYIYLKEYSSNDAVKVFNGMDYFIEFKNQDKPKMSKIYGKIKDSLLIYMDIFDENLSYTRENLGYILVYNPNKDKNDKSGLGQYEEYDKLQNKIKSLAKRKVDKFGLKSNLEEFYFKDVIVLSKDNFEKKLSKTYNIP